jgi:hypothetical protein
MSDTQYTRNQYHARREAQERDAADRAGDAGARKLHLELADRYAELIQLAVPGEPSALEA